MVYISDLNNENIYLNIYNGSVQLYNKGFNFWNYIVYTRSVTYVYEMVEYGFIYTF